ncbi:hypothetical protein RQY65_00125, partial [Streptococcus pneumoniae]|nr:hypothetical protein [Streptococcus pneumoniae]MDS9335637.1 hypothetical protein [Streptococcus pneumoniae]MDT5598724.1 hypothetical protein [Streptococcus pneumoniae]
SPLLLTIIPKKVRFYYPKGRFCSIIKNFLFYVSLGLPNPYITRFLTKNTNITFYYLLPQSTQKGEQKSPTKGLRFDEFSRQETSVVISYAFLVVFAYLIGLLYQKRECVTSRSNSP